MATTQSTYEQKSVLWKIPNFAEVLKSDELVNKQNFEMEMYVGVNKAVVPLTWDCYLCTNDEEKYKDQIGMFFSAENSPPELSNAHTRIHCQIPKRGDNYSDYYNNEVAFSIKESLDTNMAYGFPDVLPRRSEDTSFLSADGSLEIRLTLTVYHQNGELAALEAEFERRFAFNLRLHLTELRKFPLDTSEINSTGCKIVSKDGQEFSADLTILVGRSDVFSTMFKSGQEVGVVEVKDIDGEALEVLLHFLHTAKLTKNWRNGGVIEGVVYGAHKYMMKDLMEFLDKVLGLVCTKENCGRLMGLAKAHGMKKAEEQLLEYFKKNLANSLEQVTKFVQDSDEAVMLYDSTAEEQQESDDEEPQSKKCRLSDED